MDINFQSGEWLAVVAWARDQLESLRKKNDNPELSPEQTAALRGEIRFAKRLLGLADEPARKKSAGSVDSLSGGAGY